MSIVLLVGAALLTTSLRNLERQQFGFVTDGRLVGGFSSIPRPQAIRTKSFPRCIRGWRRLCLKFPVC